jgi:hypothetical protein
MSMRPAKVSSHGSACINFLDPGVLAYAFTFG